MSSDDLGLRPLPRVVAIVAMTVAAAACSSESVRFDNPFANRSGPNETTGSVPQQRAPAGRVQTSALPPPSAGYATPAQGVSGGGRGMASYQPPNQPDPVVTGAVTSPPPHHTPPPHHAPPPPAPPPRQAAIPARPTAASKAAGRAQVHVVAPGETLMKLSRNYGVPIVELARFNSIPPHTRVNIGDQIKIPGGRARTAAQPVQPEPPRGSPPKSLGTLPKAKSAAVAGEPKSEPKATPRTVAHNAAPTETVGVAAAPAAEKSAPTTSNPVRNGHPGLSFRWPAKGRIIAGFGPKTNGQTNDGINIAVPEGTPIKAAADGTVAYAGNELKGYGNLVLIRHADGYVTAYAHAKEVLVRRGDTVRRGQDIARSGQTGNVDAPQLHFEVRKGPAPIDPMPMLGGGG